jgi:hypothetical protein
MPPTGGLRLQVTAVIFVLVTEAANCWMLPAYKFAVPGVRETLTGGQRFAITLTDAAGFPATVAVTVTI